MYYIAWHGPVILLVDILVDGKKQLTLVLLKKKKVFL